MGLIPRPLGQNLVGKHQIEGRSNTPPLAAGCFINGFSHSLGRMPTCFKIIKILILVQLPW